MKTVHISTYCEPSSYGSILQALGMKNVLENLGYYSVIERLGSSLEEKVKISFKGKSIKGKVAEGLKFLQYGRLQKKHGNNLGFIQAHFDTKYYPDMACMRSAMQDEQLFLAGSDQIWNPVKMAEDFFLNHAPHDSKKISYAASMGVAEIPEENKEILTRWLDKFNSVSAREHDMVPVLSNYINRDVLCHIDPSFFLNADQWRTYQKPYPIKEPYILVYPLYWDPKENKALKEIHTKTGVTIAVVADNIRNIYANKWIFDADICQFLWLIDHAEAVVSSSFHGVSLSLNFNKPLAPIINPMAPSRITNILEVLGYPPITTEQLLDSPHIDFAKINQRIEEEKKRGINYLRDVLQS